MPHPHDAQVVLAFRKGPQSRFSLLIRQIIQRFLYAYIAADELTDVRTAARSRPHFRLV
jgi:hypothetical protein